MHRSRQVDLGERLAIAESLVANGGQSFGEGDSGERIIPNKCTLANGGYIFAQHQRSDAAIVKRVASDGSDSAVVDHFRHRERAQIHIVVATFVVALREFGGIC